MAELRRCTWCWLILDDFAPAGSELVDQPKSERRTRSHCTSPTCDWCWPCYHTRCSEAEAAGSDPGGLPPEQMTPPPPDQMT